MYTPKYQDVISASDAFYITYVKSQYQKNLEQLNLLLKEQQELIDNVNDIFKNVDEKLYSVWYYTESSIHNNGGTKTILTESEFEKLCQNTNIFLVDVYVCNDVCSNETTLPSFVDPYIDQIGNKNFNYWHRELLS